LDVIFGSTHQNVEVYDILKSSQATAAFHGVKRIDLTLSDHAMIIALPN